MGADLVPRLPTPQSHIMLEAQKKSAVVGVFTPPLLAKAASQCLLCCLVWRAHIPLCTWLTPDPLWTVFRFRKGEEKMGDLW